MSIADDYLEPGELRPCPFCGADAEVLHFEAPDCSADDDNYGGSCVQCSRCNASSAVVFGFKETLYSSWNERAIPDLSTLTRERDQLKEELERAYKVDDQKTREINILTGENRKVYRERDQAREALELAEPILAAVSMLLREDRILVCRDEILTAALQRARSVLDPEKEEKA